MNRGIRDNYILIYEICNAIMILMLVTIYIFYGMWSGGYA